MEASEVTRPSLVLRIRDHDDGDSWTEFVQLYGGLIHYYCVRRGLQEEDAAEVTQDVLLQISQSITRFDYQPERGRFRSWLATLTKSKMVELLRKKGRRHEVLTTFEEMEPTGTLDGVWCDAWNLRLTEAAMRQVKSCMSADTFEAFRAAWIDQQEPALIAKLHSKDLAWVYVCKSRGLKLLRKFIIDLADEMPDQEDHKSVQPEFSTGACEYPT